MKNKILNITLIGYLIIYANVVLAESIVLQKFAIKEQANQLEMNFNFNQVIKYHCSLFDNPDRLVVDIDEASLKKQLEIDENSFIKSVRSSDHDHKFLRLVFDLKQKIKYKTSLSKTDNQLTVLLTSKHSTVAPKENFSIIKPIDELKQQKQLELDKELQAELENHKPIVLLETPKEEFKLKKTLMAVETTPEQNKRSRVVIVIDPGHGGKDPGAAGAHGAVEKDVVLKISKQLQRMLNDEPGFCAVLTRSNDTYISLRKRLSIARKNKADMFIAIHADAYNHSLAAGASVYALSPRGATSEAARWLAEKENESELGGLSSELADKDAVLRSVLIDLSQTHTIDSSLQIGHTVLNNLGRFARLHHPRVEQAAFVVLKSPDIPSILVETGFLSNPSEEEKLTDPDYQYRTAQAIKEGIKQYFLTNSIGTWFSANRKYQDVAEKDSSVLSRSKRVRHKKGK